MLHAARRWPIFFITKESSLLRAAIFFTSSRGYLVFSVLSRSVVAGVHRVVGANSDGNSYLALFGALESGAVVIAHRFQHLTHMAGQSTCHAAIQPVRKLPSIIFM
jgi:hypothetical protein